MTLADEPIGEDGDYTPTPAPFTLSFGEDAISTALRAFLIAVTGLEVVQGQDNRVPQPQGVQRAGAGNYIIFTNSYREQFSTTTHSYNGVDSNTVARSTGFHYQVDVYGPASADTAQIIKTLYRDAYGCDFFAGYDVQALYVTDPQQLPLVNGEFQWEDRWSFKCVLQGSPAIVTPAEFATNVAVTPVELG